MPPLKTLATLIIFSFITACSSRATITLRDGMTHAGTIQPGTSQSVRYIDEEGVKQKVSRAKIVDIDHPGNGNMVIGYSLVGIAFITMILGSSVGDSSAESASDAANPDAGLGSGYDDDAIGGSLAILIAAPILVLGLTQGILGTIAWSNSRAAAKSGSKATRVPWAVAPIILSDGESPHYGAGMFLTF